jgi:LysR family transcriptional regulator, transcription activator of glutamate synthase operon
MELRQLRYLDAVARRRSFTRAALELHIAQSALSQQVARLERELGVELLRRTTRRVEVTEAGQLVLARARRALAEADGVRADLDALQGLRGARCASAASRPSVPCTPPR